MPSFTGVPYRRGGRDYTGADCVGIVALYLRDEMGVAVLTPAAENYSGETVAESLAGFEYDSKEESAQGDVLFFQHRNSALICHVAVCVGAGRWLHTVGGYHSRIDDGLKLIRRTGLVPAYQVPAAEAERIGRLLQERSLGWQMAAYILLAVALSVASMFLTPKRKLGAFASAGGRYSFDGLITVSNTTVPLPDILGAVSVAGNAVYQSRRDRILGDPAGNVQRANKVIVFASGPVEAWAHEGRSLKINGLPLTDPNWHAEGYAVDPAQTEDAAVDGDISDVPNRPSVSLYSGAHGITVPVDVRAGFDRNFPIYGFSGCAYAVFRMFDATKYAQFNSVASVRGRHVRTFDSDGFIVATATAESLAGANGTKTRFKLAHYDIISVASLTVNGVDFYPLSEQRQDGPVYHLNSLKGFVEFPTAPAASATIEITYDYFVREWTQNPAEQLVYLLTENKRGKGFGEDRINWEAADAFRQYCDEHVNWTSGTQIVEESRYLSDYAVDYRRPVQEHMKSILDAAYAYLTMSSGLFCLRPRRDDSPVFQLDISNIIAGSFSSEQVERSARANRVRVVYQMDDQYNAESDVTADDANDQSEREERWGNAGVLEESVRCPAVSRESQAQRLAQTMVAENIGSRWVVECRVGWCGMAVEAGDVIGVTHPSQPTWAGKLFRIEELSIDDSSRLELKLSEYVPAAYL